MEKIITLFQRNYETNRLVRNELTPGAEWVVAGEGTPTRKYDGTACMILNGKLFKRYEAKKEPPTDFIPAQERDIVTGHWVGWRPCYREEPSDKYHWEGFDALEKKEDGTYELLGPKIQGNPERFEKHMLLKHANAEQFPDCSRDFASIRTWLEKRDIEGIVFHHIDGRMVKIKKKDFGMKRIILGERPCSLGRAERMNMKNKAIQAQVQPVVMQLICPICNSDLRPSLGYGTGYWLCNCALGIGLPSREDKQEWVKKIESIFKYA